jgi:predicted dehydrogenase
MDTQKKVLGIGFVGVGNISGIYLQNVNNLFKEIEIIGVCDLVPEKITAQAKRYNVGKTYKDMYELFADPAVDIVLNITRPHEHYAVSKAALEAGKHVYSEKPLAATFAQGQELFALAKEKGLHLGGAPDTFLGAGIQTSKRYLDEGYIGEVIGGACHMISSGHESWHPDPAFYYDRIGGGPMLDMGPYYVTALVNLLGPAETVTGFVKKTHPTRTITSAPLRGTIIPVGCPTYYMGVIRFRNGAIVNMTFTFDVHSFPGLNNIEIYGSKATLRVPDPNGFGGHVRACFAKSEWEDVPDYYYSDYTNNSRAIGLADMAKSIQTGRKARADVQQTLHVLEIMSAFETASDTGKTVQITSDYEIPAQRSLTAEEGILDD